MTGFASVRTQTSEGELAVSLRSVNHRGLDIHFHGGNEFAAFENEVRGLLKEHIARGHVEVRFSLDRPTSGSRLVLNRAALGSYIAAFRDIAEEVKSVA